MVDRILRLPEKQNFFLFGARGTGKTTLLEKQFMLLPTPPQDTLYIDLLDPDQEDVFIRDPNHLKEVIRARSSSLKRVIVDEVQKVPRLLDVIHHCIEKFKKIQFVMTGSSARKLKHGGANLLGGRAASFYLHPLTSFEAPNSDQLLELLSWGTLPMLYQFESDREKIRFLRSYVQTYLKEEIQLEQLVRNVTAFREFLDLAAQSNCEIVNFANISKQSGVDEKTISRYFEILVDTLVGTFLEPYDASVRERQSQKPKFYLFDTGIYRQMTQSLESKLVVGSSEYGRLFEQMIICECRRLNDYFERDFRFYYLRTKDGVEIDLIVKKGRNRKVLIEIKSTDRVLPEHYRSLVSLGSEISPSEKWVLCNTATPYVTKEGVRILPWRQGLTELFEMG